MKHHLGNHIITFLFVVAFLLPRVADLHALEHILEDDSPVSCELCDVIVQTQENDLGFFGTSYFENEKLNAPSSNVIQSNYYVPRETIVSPMDIYNKPPPSI